MKKNLWDHIIMPNMLLDGVPFLFWKNKIDLQKIIS